MELDYTGPFWGVWTVICLAALAYIGWLLCMIEPWTYGVDIGTAIVIVCGGIYAVGAFAFGWKWVTEAIVPWIKGRKMAKAKA